MSKKYISKGIKFVYLDEKDAFLVGQAHGRLLKEEIKEFIDGILLYAQKKLGRIGKFVVVNIVINLMPIFGKKFDPDIKDEIKGIAQASGQSQNWIIFLNYIYEGGTIFNRFFHFLGCSGFMARCSKEEKIFIGKTTDIIPDKLFAELLTKNRIVYIYKKNSYIKTSFMTAVFPAIVVGDWGISKKGVYIGFNDGGVFTTKNDFKKGSVINLLRKLYQNASSSEKIKKLLQKARLVHPFLAQVSDGEEEGTFLAEMNNHKPEIYKFENQIIVTNFLKTCKLKDSLYPKNFPTNIYYLSALLRWENLEKHIEKCKTREDYLDLIKMKNPNFDYFKGAVSNKATVGGVFFIPKERKIFLPSGKKIPVTYYGKWEEFYLDDIFKD